MTNQTMTIHEGAGRLLAVCSLCLVWALAAGTLQAQNSQGQNSQGHNSQGHNKPSHKGAQEIHKVAVQFVGTNIEAQVGADGPGFQELVSAKVQTVQTNDLLINVGLELTLETISVPGSDGFELLDVEVFVDGNITSPQLARFGAQHAHQSPGEPDNTFSLERENAVSFSFVASDLPPGVHTILAKAYLVGSGVGGGGFTGSVGKGTMTVETVHVITNPSDIPTLD